MKVRLALEEKELVWNSRVIDIVQSQEQLEPWYVELNEKGVIPTLLIEKSENEVITDSARIIRYIASIPEGKSLIPDNSGSLQVMEALIDMADNIDLQILSYARHPSMEKSEGILNKRIEIALDRAEKYPQLKERYHICAERSVTAKQFRTDDVHIGAVERYAFESLRSIDRKLDGNTFLLGDTYSLADVIWTVVLSRLDLLGYDSWLQGEAFPLLSEYYQRVQNRKSYTQAQIQNRWWEK